jgi:hypothetical protein
MGRKKKSLHSKKSKIIVTSLWTAVGSRKQNMNLFTVLRGKDFEPSNIYLAG